MTGSISLPIASLNETLEDIAENPIPGREKKLQDNLDKLQEMLEEEPTLTEDLVIAGPGRTFEIKTCLGGEGIQIETLYEDDLLQWFMATAEADSCVRSHPHVDSLEVMRVEKGEMFVAIEGASKPIAVKEGGVIAIPPGVPHSVYFEVPSEVRAVLVPPDPGYAAASEPG